MKILLITMLMSYSVLATEYCASFSFTSGRLECLKFASENYVDDRAGEFCVNNITFDNDKMKCIKLAVNKKYRKSSLNVCAKLTFNSDKMECIEVSGKAFTQGSTMREIYYLAEDAIDALQSLDFNEALSLIDEISELSKSELHDTTK
jgi:hypothetical protein